MGLRARPLVLQRVRTIYVQAQIAYCKRGLADGGTFYHISQSSPTPHHWVATFVCGMGDAVQYGKCFARVTLRPHSHLRPPAQVARPQHRRIGPSACTAEGNKQRRLHRMHPLPFPYENFAHAHTVSRSWALGVSNGLLLSFSIPAAVPFISCSASIPLQLTKFKRGIAVPKSACNPVRKTNHRVRHYPARRMPVPVLVLSFKVQAFNHPLLTSLRPWRWLLAALVWR